MKSSKGLLEVDSRTDSFIRNSSLESLLEEINILCKPGHNQLLETIDNSYPKIFIVGPLRSGTTLMMQWIAASGLAAYPTNLLSRFYGAPLLGAKLQFLLTDPEYNFRNEIIDFNSKIDFSSENGKTLGALSPNEFWYFWRRFLPFDSLDYLPDDELLIAPEIDNLKKEINALSSIFAKPFAMKAMILNQNLSVLSELFDDAIFIWMKRDPLYNIQSVLNARLRQTGSTSSWYSFKIREYPEIKDLSPIDSAARQIAATHSSIAASLSKINDTKKIIVNYEDFCIDTSEILDQLVYKITTAGFTGDLTLDQSQAARSFECHNQWSLNDFTDKEAYAAYEKALKWLS